MAVEQCPIGTGAQTTVSVFSVAALLTYSLIQEPIKLGYAQDLPETLHLKGLQFVDFHLQKGPIL